MNQDEMRLLRSYADGPRIWDAATVVPAVFSLHDRGLIEPVPGELRGAYQLTDAGRQVLSGIAGQETPCP